MRGAGGCPVCGVTEATGQVTGKEPNPSQPPLSSTVPQWGHLCEQAQHLLLPLHHGLPGPTLRGKDPSQLCGQVSRAQRPLEGGREGGSPRHPSSPSPLGRHAASHPTSHILSLCLPSYFPISPVVACHHITHSLPLLPWPSSYCAPSLSYPAPVGTGQPAKTALRVPAASVPLATQEAAAR